MKQINVRRRLIVNKEVQFDILMYVAVLATAIFSLQMITGYFFLHKIEKIAILDSMSIPEFVSHYKVVFLLVQFIPVVFCLALSLHFFNRLSSRIVGPLYNIRKTFQMMATDKRKREIRLREHDYFKDVVDEINLALREQHLAEHSFKEQ